MVKKNRRGKILPIFMGIMALTIYGFGLVSPLTPSEGAPSLILMIIFVGIPLLLTAIGALATGSKILKLILVAEALGIIVSTIQLLRIQRVF